MEPQATNATNRHGRDGTTSVQREYVVEAPDIPPASSKGGSEGLASDFAAEHRSEQLPGLALAGAEFEGDVVAFANAGQDTDNAIKQSGEFGLVQGGQKLVGLLMFDTDVHAIGLKAAQGTYMTTASYWNMDEATRAWSKKFFARTGVMPTMIHTGVYGSVLHYLKAIKAAGTDDPAKVMAKMRELPIEDTFVHGGKLREDGRVIRDMYLAKVKSPEQSKEPWDYLDIVKTVKGEDAFRPLSDSKCPLVKK